MTTASDDGGFAIPQVWPFRTRSWLRRLVDRIDGPEFECNYCHVRSRDPHRWESVLVEFRHGCPVFRARCRNCSERRP